MLIIPVFVPHLGCPHDCCFCNQRSISGSVKIPTSEEIIEEIESYRSIACNYERTELAFFGGSFTAVSMEMQKHFLKTVFPYVIRSGNEGAFIHGLRLSTRPDCIDDKTLDQLKKYGVDTIELGAQSMDPEVLELSKRGHTPEDTVRSSKMIKEAGFALGLQTMTGLPGATPEKDLETADRIISLGPSIVRIYPTIVIKRTLLETMMKNGEYVPPTLADTVDLCAKLVLKYNKAGIKIIRMGLHSSENMCEEKDIAGGPYHPAFGELVYQRLALSEMEEKIESLKKAYGVMKKDLPKDLPKDLEIRVPQGKISVYTGNRRSNITVLKEKYGFTHIKISERKEVSDTSGPERAGASENNLVIECSGKI